ncbi:hypothetical protein ACSBL2_13565 [Pedobacter sp. AW31-3R]|uniref:hypothetical protein n=1 Tax=Pedobacter sp. AW31-3R TaxID=3445781 RepID=UPI003FA145F0
MYKMIFIDADKNYHVLKSELFEHLFKHNDFQSGSRQIIGIVNTSNGTVIYKCKAYEDHVVELKNRLKVYRSSDLLLDIDSYLLR